MVTQLAPSLAPGALPLRCDAAKPSVLILSAIFPPRSGSCVQRPYYNAEFLTALGHEVWVVTEAIEPMYCIDNEMKPVMTRQDRIIRVPKYPNLPVQLLGKVLQKAGMQGIFPDGYGAWISGAIRRASRIIMQRNISVLLVNAGHPSVLYTAHYLKRCFPRIKLVLDVQDIWADNGAFHKGPVAELITRYFERRYYLPADAVITIGDHQASELRSRYPHLRGLLVVIPHGYDESLFQSSGKEVRPDGKITFRYTGCMYPSQRADLFFDAVRKLVKEDSAHLSDVVFEFYGQNPKFITSLARKAGIEHLVDVNGRVPHSRAISLMMGADALLLFWTDDPACLTGKLSEYIRANRLILAFDQNNPDGRRMLETSGRGLWIGTFDVEKQVNTLKSLITQLRNGESLLSGQLPDISCFSRESLARKLSATLDTLSQCHKKLPTVSE